MARERLTSGGGSYFAAPLTSIQFINTGSHVLDHALGGGWAEGRIANVVGDKSSGKTLLMIEASANFARKYKKGKVRYREAESAFDKPYAGALGMPLDRVDFGDPIETVEELFADLEKIIDKARGPELAIVDSLDALSDQKEMERDFDENTYGGDKAKKMSKLFRMLTRKMERKQVTLLIVSQVRDKVGAMFGPKTTRTGGRALDFYASQVLYLHHLGRITKKVRGLNRAVGVKVQGKVEKNKISLPFRDAKFAIDFGYGVNDVQSCIDWLKECKRWSAKRYGIKEDTSKEILPHFLDWDTEEAESFMTMLHEDVSKEWYAIEQQLMPKRTKYGT